MEGGKTLPHLTSLSIFLFYLIVHAGQKYFTGMHVDMGIVKSTKVVIHHLTPLSLFVFFALQLLLSDFFFLFYSRGGEH